MTDTTFSKFIEHLLQSSITDVVFILGGMGPKGSDIGPVFVREEGEASYRNFRDWPHRGTAAWFTFRDASLIADGFGLSLTEVAASTPVVVNAPHSAISNAELIAKLDRRLQEGA